MKEEENILEYLLRVDQIVNAGKGLGANVDEKIIVQKVLRSLPMRYDAKVLVIEDIKHLDQLTMDELHGILTTYEMRAGQGKTSKKEATFKISKETKKQKKTSNENFSDDSNHEMANFIRKLKRGTDKYKGKLPLKYFNCGKIGHFATKCPHSKQEDNDKEKSNSRENKKKVK